MTARPIRIWEVRKRLAVILDNAKLSNAGGIESATYLLKNLESNMRRRSQSSQRDKIIDLVLSARAALGMGNIASTELLLAAGIKMAEKVE